MTHMPLSTEEEHFIQTILTEPSQDPLLVTMKHAIDAAQQQHMTETPYDLKYGLANPTLSEQGWAPVAELVNRYLNQRGWWFHQLSESTDASLAPVSSGILKIIPPQLHYPSAQNQPAAVTATLNPDLPRHTGVVKWYNVLKGFGFIIPDDPAIPEVFVHKSELYANPNYYYQSLAEGERVEFSVVQDDAKRTHKACNVTAPGGGFVMGRRSRPVDGQPSQPPQDVPHSHSQTNAQTSSHSDMPSVERKGAAKCGTVKWYNVKKGFGFIIPDDKNDEEIFVHRHELVTKFENKLLREGDAVEYVAELDDDNRPRAYSVTGPGGTWIRSREPRRSTQTRSSHSSGGSGSKRGPSSSSSASLSKPSASPSHAEKSTSERTQRKHAQVTPETDEKFPGVVKWFNGKRGFGFVSLDTPVSDSGELIEEVFFNRADLLTDGNVRSMTEGDALEFMLGKDESSRMKALNVTLPGGAPIPGNTTGSRRSYA